MSTETRYTLQNAIDNAVEELNQWAKDNPESDPDYDGTLPELADSACPIYTSDILNFAAEDLYLATDVPELGPAFNGEPTPTNIIAANIYEAIMAALYERWNEIEKERAERDEDDEDDDV
jgi:hypothetical protein